MKLSAFGVTARTVTIERENESRYRTKEEISVSVNGSTVLKTDKNVFTLFGLDPDTEYKIETSDGGSLDIKTAKETVLFDVRRFGAKGHGEVEEGAFIQAAIEACPEGGTVYVPKGTYLCRPLFMKSGITLYLEKEARLLAVTDRKLYPILPGTIRRTDDDREEICLGSWEGNPLDQFASLITAIGVKNFTLTGGGVIDGNAASSDWWVEHRVKRIAWRPNLIYFTGCENIVFSGIKVCNSPVWNVHPAYSKNIELLDLMIENPSDSPNTDGIDPESCEDVLILGTHISVGDDCVAIKSGKLYMAEKHFRRTERVTVRNCLFEKGHGGVTVGSEIAGGVVGVRVLKSVFKNTDRGIRIKTRRGRGEKSYLDDISCTNMIMDHVHMPLTVNMFYFCDPDGHSSYVQDKGEHEKDDQTPKIGCISFEDVECTGTEAMFVCAWGLPEEPIEKISLKNVNVSYAAPADRKADRPIMTDGFEKVTGKTLFIKNVKELEIENVNINGEDVSAPDIAEDTKADLSGLKIN